MFGLRKSKHSSDNSYKYSKKPLPHTQDAINLGACDYVMKPFDRNEFAFKVIKGLSENIRGWKRNQTASDLNASVKDGHKFGKKISLWSRCVEVGSSTERGNRTEHPIRYAD